MKFSWMLILRAETLHFCYVCCVARQDLNVFFTAARLRILGNPANLLKLGHLLMADNGEKR